MSDAPAPSVPASSSPAPAPPAPAWSSSSSAWQAAYWFVAVVVGVVVALSFGFVFVYSNQATYLVHALVASDPTLLPNDWYAREAVDYHHTFSLLASLLLPHGAVPFLVIETVLTVLGVVAIASVVKSAVDDDVRLALPVLLAWAALALVGRTLDAMGSYTFAGYLQPSSFGVCGLLWALALHLRGRFVLSGAALAVGGLLHVNVLVVGIAGFGLAQLASCVRTGDPAVVVARDFVVRCAQQLLLPLGVFLYQLPLFLLATSGPTAEATRILMDVRAPHHFRPTVALLLPFLAWQAAAVVAVVGAWRTPSSTTQRLVRLWAGVGGFVVACVPLSVGLRMEIVLRAFPWRLAPEATLLAQIIVAAALVRAIVAPSVRAVVAVVVALAVAAAGADADAADAADIRVTLALLAALLAVGLLVRRFVTAAVVVPVVIAAAVVVVAIDAVPRLRAAGLEVPTTSRKMVGLLRFAKSTPKDTVFAVPPAQNNFRLLAQRPVVVDWKSAGLLPKDVVAWYERLTALGGRAPRSRRDAGSSYERMDRARLERLKRDYGVDYVVFERGSRSKAPPLGPVAFEDKRWVVYRVDGDAVPRP